MTHYHYTRPEDKKIKLKQFEQRPSVTRGKKTNNPDLTQNLPCLVKENCTENILVLVAELTNKIKKVEDLTKAFQNKQSQSSTSVFNDSSAKERKEERQMKNQKHKKTTYKEATESETQTA